MSLIEIRCPACGHTAAVPDNYIGRRVRCKKCNTPFIASPAGPEPEPTGGFTVLESDAELGAAQAGPPPPISDPAATVLSQEPQLPSLPSPAVEVQSPQETIHHGPWRWCLDALADSLRYAHILVPLWILCTLVVGASFLLCFVGELFVIPILLWGLCALNLSIIRGSGCKLGVFFKSVRIGIGAMRISRKYDDELGGFFESSLKRRFTMLFVIYCASGILPGILGLLLAAGIESALHRGFVGFMAGAVAFCLITGFPAYVASYALLSLVDAFGRREELNPDLVLRRALRRGFTPGALKLFGIIILSWLPLAACACGVDKSFYHLPHTRGEWLVLLLIASGVGFVMGVAGLAMTHAYNDLLPPLLRPHTDSRKKVPELRTESQPSDPRQPAATQASAAAHHPILTNDFTLSRESNSQRQSTELALTEEQLAYYESVLRSCAAQGRVDDLMPLLGEAVAAFKQRPDKALKRAYLLYEAGSSSHFPDRSPATYRNVAMIYVHVMSLLAENNLLRWPLYRECQDNLMLLRLGSMEPPLTTAEIQRWMFGKELPREFTQSLQVAGKKARKPMKVILPLGAVVVLSCLLWAWSVHGFWIAMLVTTLLGAIVTWIAFHLIGKLADKIFDGQFRQTILKWQGELGLSDNMIKAALADQVPGTDVLW